MNEYENYVELEHINTIFNNKKIVSISGFSIDSEECLINFDNDEYIKIYHYQNCCESVYIEDINGDLNLENEVFYEIIEKKYDGESLNDYDSSYTWSFYTIRTSRGYIDLRWYGVSNGYYSESVDFAINYKKEDN